MIGEQEPQNDRRRFWVLILLLITTVFSAILAGLQSDAGIRADQSNIQSQYYAVLSSAVIFRQGQQASFDVETLSTHLRHAQETYVLEYSALDLDSNGDKDGAARLRVQAQSASARAEAAKQISTLFADPRFAPAGAGALPDLQAYMSDLGQEATALTQKQNMAADDYHYWDDKSDSYLTILSLLALVFFLLGVAQNASNMRIFFTATALVTLLTCGAWTIWVLIS